MTFDVPSELFTNAALGATASGNQRDYCHVTCRFYWIIVYGMITGNALIETVPYFILMAAEGGHMGESRWVRQEIMAEGGHKLMA